VIGARLFGLSPDEGWRAFRNNVRNVENRRPKGRMGTIAVNPN
jgi:hypothetical protein